MAIFKTTATKNKFLGIWTAKTRNDRGDLILLSGKTKAQAIKLANAEKKQQNLIIKKRLKK